MAKLRPWLYRLKGFDVSAHPKPYYVSSTVAGVRIVGRPDMVFQHIFLRYLLIVDFKSRYIKAGREISDYEKSQMILYMGLASGGWIRPRARLLFKNTWVTVGYNQRVFAKLTREYAHDLLCYKSGRLERIPPPIQL